MWCFLTVLCLLIVGTAAQDSIPDYNWREFRGLWSVETGYALADTHEETLEETSRRLKKPLAQEVVGKPVYMSLTTIDVRLFGIGDTIESVLSGEQLPNRIFIFISEDGHLLDKGISKAFLSSDVTKKLRALYKVFPHISVIYVDNIGPHRKLLPLLSEKWHEDCLLVTIDDHEIYPPSMLSGLIDFHQDSGGTAVVARRARRMGICAASPPWTLCPYTDANKRGLWPETKPARREMLMLPTGTGGVLYHPSFLHPVVFAKALWEATLTGDDLMFRLGTLSRGVPVVTTCCPDQGLRAPCPTRTSSQRLLEQQRKLMQPTVAAVWGGEYVESGYLQRTHDMSLKQAGKHHQHHDVHYNPHANKGLVIATKRERQQQQQRGVGTSGGRPQAQGRQRGHGGKRRERGGGDGGGGGGWRDNDAGEGGGERRLRKRTKRRGARGGRFNQHFSVEDEGAEHASHAHSRRLDARKDVSLASKFNNVGGNNAMWAKATHYLHKEGILDFNNVLSSFVGEEREGCLVSSAIFGVDQGIHGGFLGPIRNGWDRMRVFAQNSLWDAECGVQICSKESIAIMHY